MNGNDRRHRRRLQSLLAPVCILASTGLFASGALAVATVEVATSNGAPGGTVTLTMSLTREAGDPAFAGAQIDMIFNRDQLGIDAQCSASGMPCDSGLDCEDAEACGLITCDLDPRLPTTLQIVANSPRFQNVTATKKRIRLGVVGPVIPVTTFEDGTLLTCELNVPASAAPGLQELMSDRLAVSDETGDLIPSQAVVIPGSIVDPNDLTPTATQTGGATNTPTPTGGTPMPTSTPTPTGSGVIGTLTPTATMSGVVGTATLTPTTIVSATPTGGTTTSTSTPTATRSGGNGGGGGGGDGCDCAITPTQSADQRSSAWIVWLSLLPAAVLWMRRRQDS